MHEDWGERAADHLRGRAARASPPRVRVLQHPRRGVPRLPALHQGRSLARGEGFPHRGSATAPRSRRTAGGRGFPLTRLVAHMEWALEDRPGVDDLVEYETRLNYILPKYPDPVL